MFIMRLKRETDTGRRRRNMMCRLSDRLPVSCSWVNSQQTHGSDDPRAVAMLSLVAPLAIYAKRSNT